MLSTATSLLGATISPLLSLVPSSATSSATSILEKQALALVGSQIKVGQLTIIGLDGRTWVFGPEAAQSPSSRPDSPSGLDGEDGLDSDQEDASDGEMTSQSGTETTNYTSLASTANSTPRGASHPNNRLETPLPSPPESIKSSGSTRVPTPTSANFLASQTKSSAFAGVDTSRGPRATVRILSPRFYLRLITSGDLGFAESYMAGEFDISYDKSGSGDEEAGQQLRDAYYGEVLKEWKEGEALLDLFKIIIHSDHPSSPARLASTGASGVGLTTLPSLLLTKLGSYARDSRVVNSVRNSVGNIKAHYDISNRMFASFLSRDMTYSCAIFPALDSDLETSDPSPFLHIPMKRWPGDSTPLPIDPRSVAYPSTQLDELEEAQYTKLRHIIKKAGIKKGMRVLEIGSGWGSFAMEAVRTTGCTVDTLTLSAQQKILAEERIKAAGLQDSITVHLVDFRSIPDEWTHSFDRLVSIEMLEAVGKEFIEPYFQMIDKVLNSTGVACFQVITIPESRFERYSKSDDFIRKYIFPGGFLPSVAFTSECIRKGSQNRLTIDSVCNIGPHYARTLREWRIRFLKNFERDIIPALKDEHPEMTDADIQVFRRKWIYYFVYCEIGFAERIIGDHIFTLTREGNASYGCNVHE